MSTPFTPGAYVKVVFDRSTNFNGQLGQVQEVTPPPSDGDVPVKLLTGSEVGAVKFFAPYELRVIEPMGSGWNLHLDTLWDAFKDLQARENEAAKTEGLEPLCHRIGVFYTNEADGRYVLCVEYGQIGDTTMKPAYVLRKGDWEYFLVWK